MTAALTYCSECGQPLATPSAKFCSACGTPVPSASAAASAPPASGPTPVAPPLPAISPRIQPRQPAATPATGPTRGPEPSRRRGRNFLLLVLIGVGLVAAFMLGARTNGDPAATDQVLGDSSAVEPSPAGIPASGSGEPSNPDSDPSTANVTPSKPAAPVMPSVVGMVLQDAQNLLQSQGSYLMDQVDASGAGRIQFFDSNWRVCSQEPLAGSPLSTIDVVTLGAVKLDESCP